MFAQRGVGGGDAVERVLQAALDVDAGAFGRRACHPFAATQPDTARQLVRQRLALGARPRRRRRVVHRLRLFDRLFELSVAVAVGGARLRIQQRTGVPGVHAR